MTVLPDLLKRLATKMAEPVPETGVGFSHFSQNSPNVKSSQVFDLAEFPTFPTFPTPNEVPAVVDRNLTSSASASTNPAPMNSSSSEEERARVESHVEKSGKVGNPIDSISESGKSGKSGKTSLTADAAYLIDFFEESSAIREFEGGFNRPTAESLAVEDCINEITGHSQDTDVRANALARLRDIGITQPLLFPSEFPADAATPF